MNRHLLALLMVGALTATSYADWKLVSTGGPDVRYQCGLAFDSSRNVTVMFGGANVMGLMNDTWEWNGMTWTQKAKTGTVPGVRSLPYFAYDSDRKVTFMFGGYGSGINGAMNAETWEWNGASWTQKNVTGPSGRLGGGMAYDANHHVIVLFGGTTHRDGSGVVGETWTWDGSKWSIASKAGPSPRYNCHMAYDPIRQRVVLFGGTDVNENELGDTWEWNGSQWSEISNGDLIARAHNGMVFDNSMNRTVTFGGLVENESGPTVAGMETWDGNEWRFVQTQQSGIPAMRDPSVCYDSHRDRIVLFGGENSNGNYDFTNTVWEWVPEPIPSLISFLPGASANFYQAVVTLAGPAGADGTVVTFTSNKATAKVTPSIRIPAGKTQGVCIIQTSPTAGPYVTQITASVNDASVIGSLELKH
jgi:hypothetical protein